jgi:hypothetical protein
MFGTGAARAARGPARTGGTVEHGSYMQRVVRSAQMESRLGDAVIRAQTDLQATEDALALSMQGERIEGRGLDKAPAAVKQSGARPPSADTRPWR